MRRTDVVFFLSGLAALVYETIWARLMTRLLGSQAGATAVVLAVFMAGLGLGALLLARRVQATLRPQRMYAALETFVGAWAALSPAIFALLEPVDGFLARALVAGLVLLPPTIAMGATFPLMGRLTIESNAAIGAETSGFYGSNTLGACAGAVLATAVFMPLLGLRGGLWGAALCSFVAAGFGSTLRAPQRAASPSAADDSASAAWVDSFWLVPFLFGMSSLALEVILTRLLVTVTGASIYAFAIVLAVFLFGIGLGSRQAREMLRDASRAPRVLGACAVAVPLLSLLGVIALRWQLAEPDLFASLANRMPSNVSPVLMWSSHALFAALALLPPAVAFGIALPACAAVAVERAPRVAHERTLGRIYAANTLGALLGSLGAAFVLMPALGLRAGYAIALAPCILAGLLTPSAPRARWAIGAVAACALGVFALRPAERPDGAKVLLHRAGLYEMVAVEESVEPDGTAVRSIRLNGKVEASTAAVDQRLQRLLGHIPGLLHGNVKSALCIGTGTGMTAGSLLDLPTLERLTLFEIEPVVPEGTAFFGEWNNHLLDDPRLKIVYGDGRHSLFETDERFDLITADPLHVWSRGSSDLYTLEYYREMARHLAPGGVASQWIGLYELSTRDVQTVIATWCGAFGHATAYLTAYDLALVGSNDPIATDLSTLTLPPRVAERLARVGVHSGAEIAALQIADDADLRAYVAATPPMRDDLPILEFRAPFSFLKGYSEEVLRWCARPEFVARLPEPSRERGRQVRKLVNEFLDALPSGMSAASARYGHELLALPALGATEFPR
jgi:spermidine synthase